MDAVMNRTSAVELRGRGVRRRRLKLCERVLPPYTRGEEIFNMVSHIVGGALGVATLVLCVVLAAVSGSAMGVVCGAIFGTSMILLYTMSSLYHGLTAVRAKRVFQIFDHCTIYLLIAGTYTPMLLCGMAHTYPVHAWVTLGIVWGLAALSVTLTAIDISKYKVFGMIAYLALGWAIIFSIRQMYECIGAPAFMLLLSGGVLYTAGTLFFKFGNKVRYFHSVFHLFVLAGSVMHSLCVILFVI